MRAKDLISEKIKGIDGKACWKGKRYAGTKNGKDICIPVGEEKDLESEFLLKQIRARYPQAKDLESAMALDYFKSQRQDRQDISRLDLENDQEEDAIERLKKQLDQLKNR